MRNRTINHLRESGNNSRRLTPARRFPVSASISHTPNIFLLHFLAVDGAMPSAAAVRGTGSRANRLSFTSSAFTASCFSRRSNESLRAISSISGEPKPILESVQCATGRIKNRLVHRANFETVIVERKSKSQPVRPDRRTRESDRATPTPRRLLLL